MYPVALNVEKLKIILIGKGEKLARRKKLLLEAGAKNLDVFDAELPNEKEFEKQDIAMIVDLDDETSAKLHAAAKKNGALVNVEDRREFCDFFFQSSVRRGDLVISISTHGKTPGTAKLIRQKIEQIFPPEWEDYIEEIAKKRGEWKKSGANYDEVNKKTAEFVEQKGWLKSA